MGGIEPARVVQVWIQDSTEADNNKYGSGYLLTSRLVLTSAHVAQKVGDTAQVFFSYLAPAAPSGKRGSVPGQVVRSVREKTLQKGDDLALVLLNQETDLCGKVFPPDFGLLPTSGEDIPVKALGFPAVQNYPDTRNAEEITGNLGLVPSQDNLYPLHISSSTPEQVTTDSAWAGMSGAPVFYKHLLIGIVKQHPPRFGNHRLDISPIRFLDHDKILDHDKNNQTIWPSDGSNFVDIREDFIYALSEGGVPFRFGARHTQWDPENAKILGVMFNPLLNPGYGIVPFVGRKKELADLTAWCQASTRPGSDKLSLRLVSGSRGSGKTRLAKELCTKMAAQDWDTWRLAQDTRENPTSEPLRTFSLTRPTLLVIDDYADAHTDLLSGLPAWHTESSPSFPLCVLLVARARGFWTEELLRVCPAIERFWDNTKDLPLDKTPLTPAEKQERFKATYHAISLNNLFIGLSEMGVLRSAEEAANLYRRLAADNPDAYLPDLAMSLHTLAIRLFEMGDRQGALHPAEEAADLYRQFAADDPDAYLNNLAMSLTTLANGLSEMGDRQGALRSAQEATNIRRQLATDNPDAYLPNLAASLNNLANRLSEMGDPKGAREKAVESIRLLLPFAEQLPARFGALLAISALTYREACEASGGEADEELLAQVAAVLRGGS